MTPAELLWLALTAWTPALGIAAALYAVILTAVRVIARRGDR